MENLGREVNSGLNVVESWNGANSQINYGEAGDIASNRRDEQEMFALCLHIVQAAMVYVNTLMIQDILAEDELAETFTSEDYRGLTPDGVQLPKRWTGTGSGAGHRSAIV